MFMLLKDLILGNPELPLVVVHHNDDSGCFYRDKDIYEDPEGYIGEIFRHNDFQDDFHEAKTFFTVKNWKMLCTKTLRMS